MAVRFHYRECVYVPGIIWDILGYAVALSQVPDFLGKPVMSQLRASYTHLSHMSHVYLGLLGTFKGMSQLRDSFTALSHVHVYLGLPVTSRDIPA